MVNNNYDNKKMFSKCSICDKTRIFQPKIKCPEKNGIFCKKCIAAYLDNMINENDNTGIIKCPCGCDKDISMDKKNANKIKRSKTMNTKKNELVKRHDDFRQDQLKKRTTLGKIESDQDLKYYINDEILTSKCPKCHIAYHDFDGCCALVCKSCHTYFCAYCRHISPTNQEIHQHVLTCPLSQNKNHYFIQAKNKDEVNNGFILRKFKELLDRHPIYFHEIIEMMPGKIKENYEAEIRQFENQNPIAQFVSDNFNLDELQLKCPPKISLSKIGMAIGVGAVIGIFMRTALKRFWS